MGHAWRGFFEGWQGYAYWTEGIYLKPDHTLAEAHARPVREILATFRNGTGKLWMETTRQDRDIVLHYSQPSIHAAWMMKYWQKEINDGLLFYRNNRWGTEKAFYDSALDVSYMAYGQLEQGLLAQRRPRAFVLPLSSCMSMKEIEAVRQYVREGGVLIADMACALRDEHGKPYPRGMLDDVFGIERDAGYKNTIALLRGTLSGREGEAALYIEQGVWPASGKAQTRMVCKEKPAGLPLVIVNSFGKGRAIYLGFTGLYNQMRQAKPQLSGLYREVFGGVAGLRGRYRVTAGGDALLPGQTLVHACGDADYFGFYQDLSFVLPPDKTTDDAEEADVKAGARKAQFQLPAARHVYDLLDGRYLGRIDRFDFLSVPGRGRLYAALPYQVKAIDLSLPGRAQAGEVLSLTLSLRKEGTGRALHVYHLEVAGPDGKILPYYTRNLSAPDGMAECKLQFPLNAEPGRYTVTVRDAASGTRAACKVKVVR